MKKKYHKNKGKHVVVEPLEPRLLFSVDLLPGVVNFTTAESADSDYWISSDSRPDLTVPVSKLNASNVSLTEIYLPTDKPIADQQLTPTQNRESDRPADDTLSAGSRDLTNGYLPEGSNSSTQNATELHAYHLTDTEIVHLDHHVEFIFVDDSFSDADAAITSLMDATDDSIDWRIVHLSANADGIDQVTDSLSKFTGVNGVHFLSEISNDGIPFGGSSLSVDTSVTYSAELWAWGHALDDTAALTLYGQTFSDPDLVDAITSACGCSVEPGQYKPAENHADSDTPDRIIALQNTTENLDQVTDSGQAADVDQKLELVFIDRSVNNADQLITEMRASAAVDNSRSLEFIYLQSGDDGVEQISETLKQYQHVNGMHILSHGSDGQVQLGTEKLTADTVDRYHTQIADWQHSLTGDADILIYGCNVAATDQGEALLIRLSELTAADVAGSEDLTGSIDHGGDWDLEFTVGDLQTTSFFNDGYSSSWTGQLDLTAVGTETLVNTITTGDQVTTDTGGGHVDMNANGHHVIVWQDARSGNNDVYAKVYNADGSVHTAEFIVHSGSTQEQEQAVVAIADNGNFVVAWSDQRNAGLAEVFMQLYDIDGNAISAETPVSNVSGEQSDASVQMAADGSFVIAFHNHNTDDIYFQRYDANGAAQGANTRANSTTNDMQTQPGIAVNSDGSFTIAWQSNAGDSLSYDVIAQRFSSAGIALGNEIQLAQNTAGSQLSVDIDSDSSGNFVASWVYGDGSGAGIFARQFDANGAALGDQFLVNSYTTGNQSVPDVNVMDSGEFSIVWNSFAQDGSDNGVSAQLFDRTGNPIGSEHQINTSTPNAQENAAFASNGQDAVVVWSGSGNQPGESDSAGVFAQRFSLSIIEVNTTADIVDGDTTDVATLKLNKGTDGLISLREAIAAIENDATNGWILNLPDGSYTLDIAGTGNSSPLTGDLDISTDISIFGNSAETTIIDAPALGDRVFDVTTSGALSLHSLTIADASISNAAGAAINNQGTLSATDVVFDGNSTSNVTGGAIESSGNTDLSHVSLIGNSAAAGGALRISGGTTQIINSTISTNTSTYDGAGVSVIGGTATIDYSTIANNTSNSGSGGGINRSGGSVNISNSIIADNTSPFGGNDINGAITSNGYNIIEENSGFSGATGTDIPGVDPELAPLTSSYGSYVHPISSTSPALNAANAVAFPAEDQRGISRDGNPDIGAFEQTSNNPTSGLTSGIELNMNGGNDSFLRAYDGTLLGGLQQVTFEFSLAIDDNSSGTTLGLLSATSASDGNEIYLGYNTSTERFTLQIQSDYVFIDVDAASLIDAQLHHIAVTWDNTNGSWALLLDGELQDSGIGLSTGATIDGTNGDLVLGHNADDGDDTYTFSPSYAFYGTFYDVRIWSEARSAAEIVLNQKHKLDLTRSQALSAGLLANWQMAFNGSNQIIDIVSESATPNRLNVAHAAGAGFIAGSAENDLHISESAANGSSVGFVVPVDPDLSNDAVYDGQFHEVTPHPAVSTVYNTGQSFGGWTVSAGSIDLEADSILPGPDGGLVVDLSGDDAGTIISNAIATVPGQTYHATFALNGNFSGGDNTEKNVQVSAGDASQLYTVENTNGSGWKNEHWEYRTLTFNATASTTTLTFASQNNTAWGPYLADISVLEASPLISTVLSNNPGLIYNPDTDKFYRAVSANVDWDLAQTNAASEMLQGVSGTLATIRSAGENEAIRNLLLSNSISVAWIGGSDLAADGSWVWQDGSGDTFYASGGVTIGHYENFRGSEPNGGITENHTEIRDSDGTWNDRPASALRSYIVEWDAIAVLSGFTFQFEPNGDAGGRFSINLATGEITVADQTLIDYETATSHSVVVKVTDASDNTYSKTINIAVDNSIEASVAVGDSAATVTNTPVAISPMDNDAVDADGSASILDFTSPANGSLHENNDGTLTYTPNVDFEGNDNFNYLLTDSTENISHYWKLDGDAVDSVAANDGTINGTTTVTGAYGEALSFDETDDYVVIPDFSYTDNFSLTFKFRLDDNSGSGYQYIYSHGLWSMPDSLQILIGESAAGVDANLMQVAFKDADDPAGNIDSQWDISAIVGDNQWHTFTMTAADGSGSAFYLDGVLQATHAHGGAAFNPTGDVTIGSREDYDPAHYFGGALDGLQINNRALSSSEVSELHNGGDNTAAVALTVSAPLVLTVPGTQTIDEDTPLVFNAANGNALSVATPPFSGNPVIEVKLAVVDGVVNLGSLAGITIVDGGQGTGAIKFKGLESDINAALENMTFTADTNFNGNVTLTMASSVADATAGYYTFEGGNANDQSAGGSNNGNLIAEATTVIDATRGEVLSLDGNDDSVFIPGLFGNPASVTLAAWIKVNSSGNEQVVSLGDNVLINILSDDKMTAAYNHAGGLATVIPGDTVSLDWTHVAMTFDDDNGTVTLYLDGVEIASEAALGSIEYSRGTDSYIGTHGFGITSQDFDGLIDDVRVYTRALSDTEISSLATDQPTTVETVSITVSPINDTPAVTAPANALNVDEQTDLNLHGAGFVLSDPDSASGNLTATLDVGSGRIDVVPGDSGVTVTAGNGSTVVTLQGDLTELNNLLDGSSSGTIIYTNDSDTPVAATTVSLTLNDEGNTGTDPGLTGDVSSEQQSATQAINITAINDAPVIDNLNGDGQIYQAGDGAQLLDLAGDALSTDPDSTDLDGGSLTISLSGGSIAEDQVSIRHQGSSAGQIGISGGNVSFGGTIIGTASGGTGGADLLIALNTSADPTAVSALIRNITFENTNTVSPVIGPRLASFVLDDGDGDSSSVHAASINVINSTSALILDQLNSVSYNNNDGTENWSSSWSELGESTSPTNGIVSVSSNALRIGDYSLTLYSDISGSGAQRMANLENAHNATLSMEIWKSGAGSATLDLQASSDGSNWTTLNTFSLSALTTNRTTHSFDISEHTSATTTVRLIASGAVGDLFYRSGYFYADNVSIDYIPNTVPQVALNPGTLPFTENQGAVLVDPGASIFDAESTDFDGGSMVVDFTSGGTTNDQLTLQAQGSGAGQIDIIGSNVTYGGVNVATINGGQDGSTPLVLTFNAASSQLSAQAILSSLTYNNTSDAISAADRIVRVVITDGDGGTSSDEYRTISVTPINDTPAVSAPVSSLNVDEQAQLRLDGVGFGVTDADAGASLVTATLSAAEGTITVAAGNAGISVVSGNSSSSVVFTGTTSQIDTLLAGSSTGSIVYINTADDPVAFTAVTLTVNDGGSYGSDPGISADNFSEEGTTAQTIFINALNDAPVNLLPGVQVTSVDTPLTLTGANAIQINDSDAGVNSVQVTLSAVQGVITLAGVNGLSFINGDGIADTTMTLTGTLSDINAALDGLIFTPNSGYSGPASLSITTNDLGHSGSNGNQTDTDTVSIQVGASRFQEGSNGYTGTVDTFVRSFSPNGAFGNDWFVDADDPSEQGLIQFNNLFGSGAGQIPLGSTIDSASLSIYVSTIDFLDHVNVHRMLSSWTEASSWNSLSNGVSANGIEASSASLFQIDAAQVGWVEITGITATVQDWAIGGTNNGFVFIGDDAAFWQFYSSDSPTVAFRPYMTISYTPPAIPAVDLDADNSSGASGVNYTSQFTENSSPAFISDAADAVINYSSGTHLESMTIRITNPLDTTAESLLVNTSGTSISATYNTITSTLTLTNTDTIANYQAVLRSVAYNNNSESPDPTSRVIEVEVNSAFTSSNTATATLAVNTANDSPVLDNSGDLTLPVLTEDDTNNGGQTVAQILASDSGTPISDVDAGAFHGIAITTTTHDPGVWQYSTNGGTTWNNVAAVSESSALLLRSSDHIRFTPDGDNGTLPTGRSFSFHAWDQTSGSAGTKVDVSINGGTTAFSTATETASILTTPVNDAPVLDNSINLALATHTEDDPAPTGIVGTPVSDLVLNSLNVTDVDNAALAGIAVTATDNTHGNWWYKANNSLPWQPMPELSETSALLLNRDTDSRIYFQPEADYHGTMSDGLTFRAWDQTQGVAGTLQDVSTNGGTTAFSSATDTTVLIVSSVNDAPQITGTSVVTDGNFDNGLAAWTSAGNIDSVSGQIRFGNTGGANGSLTQNLTTEIGKTYHLSFDYGDNSTAQSQSMNIDAVGATNVLHASIETGSADNNIQHYAYTFVADATNTAITFSDTSTDHTGVRSFLDRVHVATDAAPTPVFSYVENQSPAVINANLNISDIDDNQLVSAVIQITNGHAADQDTLTFIDQSGISGSYDSVNGTLTLSGAAATADYETALRSITYTNSSEHPTTDIRTLTFTVNDGDVDSNVPTSSITILPVNDPPILTSIESSPLFYIENSGALEITNTLIVNDIDDSLIESATIHFTSGYNASEDVLGFSNQSGISGSFNNTTGVLTLTGPATLANYETALRNVTYTNTSADPVTTPRTVSITINDGNANSNVINRNVSVAPVNNPPVQSAIEAVPLNYIENSGAQHISSTVTITDVDDTEIESAVVQISTGFISSEDLLSFSNQSGISGSFNSTTGVLTLTGPATLANYETALRNVTYTNTSADPVTAPRTVSITINDGNANSNVIDRDISVAPVNNPPVQSAIEAVPLNYIENSGTQHISSTVTITDVDDTEIESAVVQISTGFISSEDLLSFSNQAGISGSFNSATGSLLLTGTASLTDYETALRSVSYTNSAEHPDTTSRTVTFAVHDGDTSSTIVSRDILITPVNDSPVQANIESLPLLYIENSGAVTVTDTLTVIDVDDSHIESATVQITTGFITTEDELVFTNQSGISASFDDINGLLTLVGSATSAEYQAALRSVAYVNTSDAPDPAVRRVTFTVNDGDGNSNALVRSINVSAVNDLPGQSGIEATPLLYTENSAAVAITNTLLLTDVDDSHIESATIEISGYISTEDVLAFSNQSGISGSIDINSGTLTLSGTATLADYEAALRSITYTNTSDNPAPTIRQAIVTINDGDGNSNAATRDISITPVNDASVQSAIEPTPLFYAENAGALNITETLSVVDVDDTIIESATVQITSGYTPPEDMLNFDDQFGISGNFDENDGILILSGSATLAEYVSALRSVTYTNNSDNPDITSRVVSFTLFDGDNTSNVLQRTIDYGASNDAPTISSIEPDALTYDENAIALISEQLQLADLDDLKLDSALVRIGSGYQENQDRLLFTSTPTITGDWNVLSGELTLTGTDTVAAYQTALRSISYQNISDDPVVSVRTVNYTVNDGTDNSGIVSRNIIINTANDAPLISNIETADLLYRENSSGIAVSTNVTLSDIDDTHLEEATISFDTGYQPLEDQLNFINTPTITGVWDSTSGQLRLSGTDTVAAYQAALRSVTFENNSDNPDTGTRTFSLTVGDGDVPSATQSRSIVVIPVNDAPTGTDNTISLLEDTFYTFNSEDFGFNDSNDNHSLGSVIIDHAPEAGTLQINGFTISAGHVVTFSQLDSQSLRYLPDPDGNGISYDSIQFRVKDDGGVANGGTDISATPNTLTLDVVNVNDAPTGQNNTVQTPEDTPYIFKPADFLFTDSADNDALESITITSLPVSGLLEAHGTPVSINQEITVTDLASGLLIYIPALNEYGASHNGFGFQVKDNGGTLNNGIALDQAPAFISFDVPAVNDPPLLVNEGATFDEGSDSLISTTMLSGIDADDQQPEDLTFTLTSVPINGFLSINGQTMSPGSTFTLAHLIDEEVRYVHDGSETSNDHFDISLMDGGEDNTQPVTGRFSLIINEVIDTAPVLENDSLDLKFGQAFDSNNGDLLASGFTSLSADTLLENTGYLIEIEQPPQHGTVSIAADGTFIYKHNGGGFLQDEFTYRVTNEDGVFTIASVSVSIEPPLASAHSVSTTPVPQTTPIAAETDEETDEPTVVDAEPSTEEQPDFQLLNKPSNSEEEQESPSVVLSTLATDAAPTTGQAKFDYLIDVVQHNKNRSAVIQHHDVNVSTLGFEVIFEVQSFRPADAANNKNFLRGLADLESDLQDLEENQKRSYQLAGETILGVSLGATAGGLAWVLRGGALLASVVASTPLWANIDPLRAASGTLSNNTRSEKDFSSEDREVESLFDGK